MNKKDLYYAPAVLGLFMFVLLFFYPDLLSKWSSARIEPGLAKFISIVIFFGFLMLAKLDDLIEKLNEFNQSIKASKGGEGKQN